ncbi:MAG TPA: cytochrome D1 domain-containing protein [Xanthobacteraceae bacterium]|nr:cytochrome D1 domain-containing protein [Xanthobacteraceae bacterium]
MTAMRTILTSLSLVLVAAAVPASASTSRIYITNSAGDSINVIDPETNTVVQTIKGEEAAHGINFSPDGTRVYVSNEATSTLDVFDQKTGNLIKKVTLSNHPNNITVAKDGRIFVGIAREPGGLDIIDPVTLTLKKTVPMRGRLHNIYMTPDQKYVICGSVAKKFVSVVDAQTETVAWDYQYDLGVRPMTIEANPDGSTKRIFVQLASFDGFSVLDFAKREEVARIKLPELNKNVDMDPGRLDAPSHGIGVHPDGKTLWVTSIPQNAVFVYSLADLKLIGQIDLPELKIAGKPLGGAVANWVTFTPDGKTIYIANSGLRSVTAIDTASMKVKAVVPVGEVPKRINTLVMN